MTVVGRGEPQGERQRPTWTVRCVCGTVKDIREDVLVSGRAKSCGCAASTLKRTKMEKRYSLVNKRFGRLWVVWRADSLKVGESSHAVWHCKCTCGNFLDVKAGLLNSGEVRGCKDCSKIITVGEITTMLEARA